MMKYALLLFTILTITSAHLHTADVPLFLWSKQSFFSGQNLAISESLNQNDVLFILQNVITKGKAYTSTVAPVISKDPIDPEVVVLYLEPKLRTDQIASHSSSFGTLRDLVLSSKSSVHVPFVDIKSSLDDNIISIAKQANTNGGKIIYIGQETSSLLKSISDIDGLFIVSPENIEKSIKEHSNLLSNGVTDIIIVNLDQNANTPKDKFDISNSMIARIESAISEFTANYVGIYTGLSYDAPVKKHFQQKRNVMQTPEPSPVPHPEQEPAPHPEYEPAPSYPELGPQPDLAPQPTPPKPPHQQSWFWRYFGGWFWEVLIFVVITTPILVSGVYAIDGIQTPDHFPKPKPRA